MSWLSRLINIGRAGRVERELDDEQRFHLESRIDDLVRSGLTREQATTQAMRQFGGRLRQRDASHDVKLVSWLDSLVRDVRVGLRMLRKDAIVSGAAIVSLALALGACTAAFSLVDALMLRPLPVRDPDRLVHLTYIPLDSGSSEEQSFSYPLFERLRDRSHAQVALFAASFGPVLRAAFDGGEEERVRVQHVSGSAFGVLGVGPALGRVITNSDDVAPDRHPVAVLSHAFWQRRFGGDRSVIGRTLTMADRTFQIVGVADPTFTGVEHGRLIDLWVPTMMNARAIRAPDWTWFRILGRLEPGVTRAQALPSLQQEFTAFRRERAGEFRADEPRDRVAKFISSPLLVNDAATGPSSLRREFQRPLFILATVVGLVLIIAATNIANLMLARAASRAHEMSLRVSIGAGRARLVQQVLVEGAIVAIAAAVPALLFAQIATPVVVGMLAPAERPAWLDLTLSWRALAFFASATTIAALLFGLAPALRSAGAAPAGVLHDQGQRTTARSALLRSLVGLQVAFSLAVLFVAGLLLSSFGRLASVDLGFDKTDLLLVSVRARELPDGEARSHTAALEILSRVRQLPGVRSAAFSNMSLFGGAMSSSQVRVPGRALDTFEPRLLAVSPGYFETMRMSLLEGRATEPRDGEPAQPSTVVVNQAFARRYFGDESPVGRVFDLVDDNDTRRAVIVGIVGNAKYDSVWRPAPPTIYAPLRGLGTLAVRTSMDAAALRSAIVRELHAVDRSIRVPDMTMQERLVNNSLLRERLLALLSGFFAAVGLLLTVVGLYGVTSFAVIQRTREIGIRMALGASRAAVVGAVLRQTAIVTLIGVAAGLAAGIGLAQPVRTLLYEITPLDVSSLALPVAALLAAGGLAALRPAYRAARVDPVIALRNE
jgi:predicted permease